MQMSVTGWPVLLLIIAHSTWPLKAQDAESESMRQLLQSMMLEDALSGSDQIEIPGDYKKHFANYVAKRFSEFVGGKRFSEFLGGKKRFSEFLGGKKRSAEFLGGKKRSYEDYPLEEMQEKRFSEFLGGKKRFSEFLGGKRSAEFLGGKKRFSEFLGGKKRFSEFLGGKRSTGIFDTVPRSERSVDTILKRDFDFLGGR